MLLPLCTSFQVFVHFALQSSPMKLYVWYFSCKHFPEITHQYILFAPLFLETFRNICVTFCCEKILLDIGLNLRYSLVLQITNIPYSLKKSLLCEIIFVEEFYTFTKRGTETALFLFSATHSKFWCSAKIIYDYFAKHQNFFYCKIRVVRTIAVFTALQ